MPIGVAEFMENQENRCPVVLVLDTSGSMQRAPIGALNDGIKIFQQDVLRDTQAMLSVETAIVTFGNGGVKTVQDFVGIDQLNPPNLEAGDLTPMGAAIESALDLVEDRKAIYKSHGIQYYRPWVFLITDGSPTDQWQNAAQRVKQAEAENRLLFFSVGVDGADMAKLKQISNNPPVLLNGLDFRDLFQWLSSSMKLTFPVIFLFERSPNFSLSQSLILSSAIVIKSSLLKTAKSLKPLFCRHFQT